MRRFKLRISESVHREEESKEMISQGVPNLWERVEKRVEQKFEPLERRWISFRENKYIGVLCIVFGILGTIVVILHDGSDVPVNSTLSKVSDAVEPSNSSISFSWIEPEKLLASTPERRSQAAKALGIEKGEWIVTLISISCGDCDREAQKLKWVDTVAVASEREAMKLNEVESTPNIIAVTVAPQSEIDEWKKSLGINYRVVGVTQNQFENFGAVILPTLVHFKDGQAVGVTERAIISRKD